MNQKKKYFEQEKCKYCGKFISYKQMQEQKDVTYYFIPDSDVSSEVSYWYHNNCNGK